MNPYINDDPDGEEEAENTEIAIWICSYIYCKLELIWFIIYGSS